MITPKLGGEPIPSAFCCVPKYKVFSWAVYICVLYRHETMCA